VGPGLDTDRAAAITARLWSRSPHFCAAWDELLAAQPPGRRTRLTSARTAEEALGQVLATLVGGAAGPICGDAPVDENAVHTGRIGAADPFGDVCRTAAALWRGGHAVQWAVVQSTPGRRISLPGHPFRRRDHRMSATTERSGQR
jgi:acyl transferase domain-containing protein